MQTCENSFVPSSLKMRMGGIFRLAVIVPVVIIIGRCRFAGVLMTLVVWRDSGLGCGLMVGEAVEVDEGFIAGFFFLFWIF